MGHIYTYFEYIWGIYCSIYPKKICLPICPKTMSQYSLTHNDVKYIWGIYCIFIVYIVYNPTTMSQVLKILKKFPVWSLIFENFSFFSAFSTFLLGKIRKFSGFALFSLSNTNFSYRSHPMTQEPNNLNIWFSKQYPRSFFLPFFKIMMFDRFRALFRVFLGICKFGAETFEPRAVLRSSALFW